MVLNRSNVDGSRWHYSIHRKVMHKFLMKRLMILSYMIPGRSGLACSTAMRVAKMMWRMARRMCWGQAIAVGWNIMDSYLLFLSLVSLRRTVKAVMESDYTAMSNGWE